MSEIRFPKGEFVWKQFFTERGELRFIITSKSETNREWYYLYALTDGVFKKLGKGKAPPDLEEKFDVDSRLK